MIVALPIGLAVIPVVCALVMLLAGVVNMFRSEPALVSLPRAVAKPAPAAVAVRSPDAVVTFHAVRTRSRAAAQPEPADQTSVDRPILPATAAQEWVDPREWDFRDDGETLESELPAALRAS